MKTLSRDPRLLALVLALGLVGCSGDDESSGTKGHTPAVVPPFPQVPNLGGPTLSAPHLVPVYFPGDPLESKLEAFHSWLSGSDYVAERWGEYGVAPPSLAPPVHVAAPPANELEDTDITAWLAEKITSKDIPPPDANTVYLAYFPSATTVKLGSAVGCTHFGAYHRVAAVPGGSLPGGMAPYVVLPRCPGDGRELDMLTNYASHELIEVVTDPMALDAPAWQLPMDAGSSTEAWITIGGPKLGDLCENQVYDLIDGYYVQDVWSNAAAADFRNPCQPSDPKRPYFTTVSEQTVYHAAPGETVLVQATATSNLPRADWKLALTSYPPPLPNDFDGQAVLSREKANNGDPVTVTVEVPQNPPQSNGRSVYRFTIDALTDDDSGFYHPWPVMIVVH